MSWLHYFYILTCCYSNMHAIFFGDSSDSSTNASKSSNDASNSRNKASDGRNNARNSNNTSHVIKLYLLTGIPTKSPKKVRKIGENR